MAKSYEETLRKHLRITVLRLLDEQSDRTLNESIITDLIEGFGFNPSRAKVRTELAWLDEQGLVDLEDMEGIFVATLTQRGADVANGRVTVPGVKRPNPRH